MRRKEALRMLGLGEDATRDDIKVAYREMVQILHPDRFVGNKKLQDKATEQFKNLQEAYESLISGSAQTQVRSSSPDSSSEAFSSFEYHTQRMKIEAQLAGIAAARTALLRQQSVLRDERQRGIVMACGGGIVTLLLWRITRGLLRTIAAIASAIAIWGIVQVVSSQRSLTVIDLHLSSLRQERAALEKKRDSFEREWQEQETER